MRKLSIIKFSWNNKIAHIYIKKYVEMRNDTGWLKMATTTLHYTSDPKIGWTKTGGGP